MTKDDAYWLQRVMKNAGKVGHILEKVIDLNACSNPVGVDTLIAELCNMGGHADTHEAYVTMKNLANIHQDEVMRRATDV